MADERRGCRSLCQGSAQACTVVWYHRKDSAQGHAAVQRTSGHTATPMESLGPPPRHKRNPSTVVIEVANDLLNWKSGHTLPERHKAFRATVGSSEANSGSLI